MRKRSAPTCGWSAAISTTRRRPATSASSGATAAATQRRSALAYPALRGANQLLNASAALAALEALRDRLPVSAQDVRLGLANVELPGRFQVLPGKPAGRSSTSRHNPHAAAVLAQNLGNMGFFPYTYAVFGAMRDKDIAGVLAHLKGEIDHWCVTDLPTPRAASARGAAKRPCASRASTTAPTAA